MRSATPATERLNHSYKSNRTDYANQKSFRTALRPWTLNLWLRKMLWCQSKIPRMFSPSHRLSSAAPPPSSNIKQRNAPLIPLTAPPSPSLSFVFRLYQDGSLHPSAVSLHRSLLPSHEWLLVTPDRLRRERGYFKSETLFLTGEESLLWQLVVGMPFLNRQNSWGFISKLYVTWPTGQDKAIKNCSPDHNRGGVKIQKVWIAYSEFSHLRADHLAGPSNISLASHRALLSSMA